MTYLTFAEQVGHYMRRGDEAPLHAPFGGVAAWTASDLAADPSWIEHLSAADAELIDQTLDAVEASRIPMTELTKDDINLGYLATSVHRWSEWVSRGRGIGLIRGFPVDRWSVERSALATWCLGVHLGRPGAQNPRGDLLGHVQDLRLPDSDANARLYQTPADIRFHCDYADVVGLMCLEQAPVGGESRVASSVAIHDELWISAPAAAERLTRPVWLDARDEGVAPAIEVTPFACDGERLRVFYHSDYFRSAARHGGKYVPSDELLWALDRFDELAADDRFCVSMRLEPGDLQLVSNHTVVHSRTEYQDDPLAPRHLLRLWLSIDREV